MDSTHLLLWVGVGLFGLGLLGVVIRRNLIIVLMCLELMLNGALAALVAVTVRHGSWDGAALVFLVFVVAAAELGIAIPIVLLLLRRKRSLDLGAFDELKG